MGYFNPPVPWSELERQLSDEPRQLSDEPRRLSDEPGFLGDGGDSPAWSRHREAYVAPPAVIRRRGTVPYAELHCHSHFSFLDGASGAEELVEEACEQGLEALALTDHDGFYGVVRFAGAARELGLPTVFGSELTLGGTPGSGDHDGPHPPPVARPTRGRRRSGQRSLPGLVSEGLVPDGVTTEGIRDELDLASSRPDPGSTLTGVTHLVVIARDPVGYGLLARAASESQLRGEKGSPVASLPDLASVGGMGAPSPASRDHWLVLTGCRKGAVPRALVEQGPAAAEVELRRLVEAFGVGNVAVELWDHGHPLDSARNDALAELAIRVGTDLVATNNVHYASPKQRPLATAIAAVNARCSLDELDGWLPAAASAHLRSGAEQSRRFARYPGVVERSAELGLACAFDLSLVAPNLPPFPCPDGLHEMAYLRQLVAVGAERRYGPPQAERVPGAYAQIEHELALIEQLGFPGYFLVVWDLVDFCRRSQIYCQGRGSAANSAVCFALGITNADAVALGLLFERFLSPERDGPPDIDIDIESDRREEVIQYVYAKHGRRHAAQVANVITYRAKSAVRDMAKALGYAVGQQDAWSKQVDRWSAVGDQLTADGGTQVGIPKVGIPKVHGSPSLSEFPGPSGPSGPSGPDGVVGRGDIPAAVVGLALQVEHAPRHLGIHSGGMVMCDRPVIEVCPVEWARMEGRSVLQWDKDDCAAAGLVKFDLLGLGMLSALHYTVDFVREAHGLEADLATLPQDPAVYDMLCVADTIGVFQIESRAQMATLPRLKPRCFYDLVVEVALIRPGPIQGGSVHPYIRRRNGTEPVSYLHPLLEKSLAKTLGIPLFQEQLMQMSIDVAGFTPSEADQLRQAMGAKRSHDRMERLRARFHDGTAANGVTPGVSEQIWDKLAAFANYGFPESHSVSFAYLVYASSWFKRYYPAAFCAGLLDAQPMGFYSPHSLVQDARRHGVTVHTPDINTSEMGASLAWPTGPRCGLREEARDRHPSAVGYPFGGRLPVQPDVRLGLSSVRGLGTDLTELIVAERDANGLFRSMEDLARRVEMRALAGGRRAKNGTAGLTLTQLEALATAGAFSSFDLTRRSALWSAGAVMQGGASQLEGIVTGVDAPELPGMSERETAIADLWATGVSPDGHPTRFVRQQLDELGVIPAANLAQCDHGSRVWVGGVVTHRQRPATAAGTTFINLEDETGLVNVICSKGCWTRFRAVARGAPALLIRGRLEKVEGVVNIVADKLEPLPVGAAVPSRDFR